MMQTNATVVFSSDRGVASGASVGVRDTFIPARERESSSTVLVGPYDLRKPPVTVIPSYNLQGADRFIMPALQNSNEASLSHKDVGIQEQLSSICQVRAV
jgi:hypothetical protein